MDQDFPQTRLERAFDRIRHWWHVRRLPRMPAVKEESWDDDLLYTLLLFLDDD